MTTSIVAATMPAPREPVRLREFAAPDPQPGGAVLRTIYSEVCGTDVHLHEGRLAGVPYPLIPGHVSVGVLTDIRGTVRDVEGGAFREGDVVTFLDVHETCNSCYQCLVAKQSTRCPHRKVYGITYGAKDGLLGGWSQAIWMKPGVKIVRMPADLPPETFIGGGCGLVTALHAVDRGEIRLGHSVAVLGVGPVGQSAHGRGVDLVIEAAGAPEAVGQALDLVRDGGRVVICGQYTDHGPTSINPHSQINRKHVEMRGCWGSDFSHFHRAVALAARHANRVPWAEMAKRRFDLAHADEALRAVATRDVLKAVIVPNG